jgi:hypothetical protein
MALGVVASETPLRTRAHLGSGASGQQGPGSGQGGGSGQEASGAGQDGGSGQQGPGAGQGRGAAPRARPGPAAG